MTAYLLDTHTALWWAAGSPRLSRRAIDIIKDGNNSIWLSVVSVWEASIKSSLGKMSLPDEPGRFFQALAARSSFSILPIQLSHAAEVYKLPAVHKDPFDRLLASQSLTEGLILISDDSVFQSYPVAGLVS